MDTETLEVFIEVMQRGSFAAVARRRGVAPSSVSRSVAALEQQLGLRLFQRTTRRLSATEAGSLYFARVQPLLEELQRAHEQVLDVAAEARGTLVVTAPVSFAQRVLLPLLPALLERHPQLHVDLRLTDAMVDLVAERIDVAVRLGRLPDSDLVARRLTGFDFVVCAAPAYLEQHGRPRRPADLARHAAVIFEMGPRRSRWRFRRAGEECEVEVSGRCVMTNAMAVRRCAELGLGVALLPRWLVAEELAAGMLAAVLTRYEATATDFEPGVWLLHPSRRYVPLKVRAFIEAVDQALRPRRSRERAQRQRGR